MKQTKPVPSNLTVDHKGITALVKKAFDAGYSSNQAVLKYLTLKNVDYKNAIVFMIAARERKRRGLMPQSDWNTNEKTKPVPSKPVPSKPVPSNPNDKSIKKQFKAFKQPKPKTKPKQLKIFVKPKPVPSKSKDKSTGLTFNVRKAFKSGFNTTGGVLEWFKTNYIEYNEASLRMIVARERKKLGLMPQSKSKPKPKGICKGITALVRNAMEDAGANTDCVFWWFDKNGITYNRDSVRRILNKELKKLGLKSQSEQFLTLL